MGVLQEFFVARPMAFALTLEALSLLVIAPLTARIVAWQENRKWRPARQALAADLISDAFTLVHGIHLFLDMVPQRDGYVRQNRTAFHRMMSIAPGAGVHFAAADDAVELMPDAGAPPAGLEPHEVLRIESPASVLAGSRRATASLAGVEAAATRLEERIRRYGFCFSPEMVLIITGMFSRRVGETERRVQINPYGAGGSDAVFLREVSASARSLRNFVDYWSSAAERLRDPGVRETLVRLLHQATHFDLSVLAAQMETLMRHVRLPTGRHPQVEEKLAALKDPQANDSFRAAIEGFAGLLADFDRLHAEFAEMREAAVERFAMNGGQSAGSSSS